MLSSSAMCNPLTECKDPINLYLLAHYTSSGHIPNALTLLSQDGRTWGDTPIYSFIGVGTDFFTLSKGQGQRIPRTLLIVLSPPLNGQDRVRVGPRQ